jgi:D-sedoheptulose 7-phosphate isomerase
MKNEIAQLLNDSASLKARLAADQPFLQAVSDACQVLYGTISKGGTIYACGNGGSTCDAMHLVEELVAKYKRERRGIRAQHFMDPSVITCWSNDYSFQDAYRRYADVFCTERDTLVAISTSGNSENIIVAAEQAKKRGTKVIGLTGRDGGALARVSDIAIVVPAAFTERIQEVHITVVHIWLELLETRYLNVTKPSNDASPSDASDSFYERPSANLA